MKSLVVLSFTLFWLIGCASGPQRYDDDKNDSRYWSSGASTLPHDPDDNHSYTFANQDAGTALVAGILGAGALLAMNRDYYKHSAITGRVVCRGRGKNDIEIPCGPVEIILLDERNQEQSRTQTEADNFAFRVKADTTYRLRIDSRKYEMTPPQTQGLVLGNDVILRLSSR